MCIGTIACLEQTQTVQLLLKFGWPKLHYVGFTMTTCLSGSSDSDFTLLQLVRVQDTLKMFVSKLVGGTFLGNTGAGSIGRPTYSAATDDRKVAGSNAACAASKLGLVVSPSIACVVFRAESSP